MEKQLEFINIVKNIFKHNVLRLILIGTLVALTLIPLIGYYIAIPAFYNQMIFNTLDEAKRVGDHIARHQDTTKYNTVLDVAIKKLVDDFKLEKVKLFNKDGYIVFSTEPKDIGEKNKHDYFYNKVAKGEIFYKVANKGMKTLEDRIVQKDVAEIYIPIMKNGVFHGASEIYYDITVKREAFNNLTYKINSIDSFIAFLFFIFIIFMLYNASKNNLKEKQIEEDIKKLNDSLQDQVDQKTKELKVINENLEIKINQELQKSREKDRHLLEQSKNASLGEMIGNIAHQWRQPLSAITSTASSIKLNNELGISTNEETNEKMDVIINKANYLSETIETFRHFLKDDKVIKEFTVETIITKSLQIIGTTLKDLDIKLVDKVDYNKKTKLKGIESELSQVIINIVNNAKDILIEKKIEKPFIEIQLIKKEDNIVITIEDNGGGIPQNIMPKIFEPYFTTKHQSQGTGLGLHMSYKIVVDSLHGELYVNNTKNGAKFYVELPLSL